MDSAHRETHDFFLQCTAPISDDHQLIPSGKRLQKAMNNHHLQLLNQQTQWPFSVANCNALPEGIITLW